VSPVKSEQTPHLAGQNAHGDQRAPPRGMPASQALTSSSAPSSCATTWAAVRTCSSLSSLAAVAAPEPPAVLAVSPHALHLPTLRAECTEACAPLCTKAAHLIARTWECASARQRLRPLVHRRLHSTACLPLHFRCGPVHQVCHSPEPALPPGVTSSHALACCSMLSPRVTRHTAFCKRDYMSGPTCVFVSSPAHVTARKSPSPPARRTPRSALCPRSALSLPRLHHRRAPAKRRPHVPKRVRLSTPRWCTAQPGVPLSASVQQRAARRKRAPSRTVPPARGHVCNKRLRANCVPKQCNVPCAPARLYHPCDTWPRTCQGAPSPNQHEGTIGLWDERGNFPFDPGG
jgi:hypothetical protein